MVCTLIDHRNDVINVQNPSGTTSRWRVVSLQSFEHFYGVISMIYKSVDHGKLWSICFCTITFIFHQLLQVVLFQPREATFFLLFFVFLLYLCSFKHQLTHRNFQSYVKIWFFFVHVGGLNYFYEKPKTKRPALRDMLRHFRGLYSHMPQPTWQAFEREGEEN